MTDSEAFLISALEFYADPRRYDGPNQRLTSDDKYTPTDAGYMQDVTRDGGALARKTLAAIRGEI